MTAVILELPLSRPTAAQSLTAVGALLDYTALPTATRPQATPDGVLLTVATLHDLAVWARCDAEALSPDRRITRTPVPGGFTATVLHLALTSRGRAVRIRVAAIHPADTGDTTPFEIGVAA